MLNLSSIESAIKAAAAAIPAELKSFIGGAIALANINPSTANAAGDAKRSFVVALVQPLVSAGEAILHGIVQTVYDEVKAALPAPLQPVAAAVAPVVQAVDAAIDTAVASAIPLAAPAPIAPAAPVVSSTAPTQILASPFAQAAAPAPAPSPASAGA